jgi:hypothetical protein
MHTDLAAYGYAAAVGAIGTAIIDLALALALLFIALGPVRRARPEATRFFVAAALVSVFVTIAAPVLPTLLSVLAASGDWSAHELSMRTMEIGWVLHFVRAFGAGIALFGIVRLAGPGRDPREPG